MIGDVNKSGGVCGCCEDVDLINAIFGGEFEVIEIYEVTNGGG